MYCMSSAIHFWVSSWPSLTWNAHKQTFILEIKIQYYLHPPLLLGGFKRRTKRCDRYCREILPELKLIQGLNHSKDEVHEWWVFVLVNRNESLKRKKLYHLSFYIYKLRDIQWERWKCEKKLSKRRILFTASTPKIRTSVNFCWNTNLITINEKWHFRTHSAHPYTWKGERTLETTSIITSIKHFLSNSLEFWELQVIAFLLKIKWCVF